MKRRRSEKRGRRRRLLFALVGVVCLAVAGAAIAVVAAGGSSGGSATSATASRSSSPANQRSEAAGKPARRRITAAALVRRYLRRDARQRRRQPAKQAAGTDQGQPAGNPARQPVAPATRGAGAFGPVRGGRTSCHSVVHIGDSTSEGLDSPDYLANPHERIGHQYARVGATTWHPEITGATSVVETLPGGTNAHEVAVQVVHRGYRGCWVIALGTNDTADVAVGSTVGLTTRINRMMSAIGSQPVMWVSVKSLVTSGPYAESNMQRWNTALVQACSRYPNMRVFDWASVVKDGWFTTDGIHYTSSGYAARSRLIADALTKAFPATGGTSPGCVVQ